MYLGFTGFAELIEFTGRTGFTGFTPVTPVGQDLRGTTAATPLGSGSTNHHACHASGTGIHEVPRLPRLWDQDPRTTTPAHRKQRLRRGPGSLEPRAGYGGFVAFWAPQTRQCLMILNNLKYKQKLKA